jgi:Uma2 family endonuclease
MAVRTETTPHPSKLTYEDYVTLPDDGRRYEILDGELAVSPSPLSAHQRVSENLGFVLSTWVRTRRLGRIWYAPLDLILADTVVVQPDIMYVSRERAAIVTRRGVEGPPDVVVEILSDSTERRDRGAKKQIYERYGINRYWLVDPDACTLEIYALRANKYERLAAHVDSQIVTVDLPAGLEIRLADLWAAD